MSATLARSGVCQAVIRVCAIFPPTLSDHHCRIPMAVRACRLLGKVKRKYDLVWSDASGTCGATVQGHDGFYDCKPEPGPAQITFVRAIDPVKTVKNAIHMLRRNHGATIHDVPNKIARGVRISCARSPENSERRVTLLSSRSSMALKAVPRPCNSLGSACVTTRSARVLAEIRPTAC